MPFKAALLATVSLASTAAWAHGGDHTGSLYTTLAHVFTHADHLPAALAVLAVCGIAGGELYRLVQRRTERKRQE